MDHLLNNSPILTLALLNALTMSESVRSGAAALDIELMQALPCPSLSDTGPNQRGSIVPLKARLGQYPYRDSTLGTSIRSLLLRGFMDTKVQYP